MQRWSGSLKLVLFYIIRWTRALQTATRPLPRFCPKPHVSIKTYYSTLSRKPFVKLCCSHPNSSEVMFWWVPLWVLCAFVLVCRLGARPVRRLAALHLANHLDEEEHVWPTYLECDPAPVTYSKNTPQVVGGSKWLLGFMMEVYKGLIKLYTFLQNKRNVYILHE